MTPPKSIMLLGQRYVLAGGSPVFHGRSPKEIDDDRKTKYHTMLQDMLKEFRSDRPPHGHPSNKARREKIQATLKELEKAILSDEPLDPRFEHKLLNLLSTP